jgi:hypothetical protein
VEVEVELFQLLDYQALLVQVVLAAAEQEVNITQEEVLLQPQAKLTLAAVAAVVAAEVLPHLEQLEVLE